MNCAVSDKSYSRVVDYIKNGIIYGVFKTGDKLPPERLLAEKLKVGRYSVREAMRILEGIGIIKCRVGDGNYISSDFKSGFSRLVTVFIKLDKNKAAGLSGLRRGLEFEIIFSLINTLNENDFKRLREIINCMKVCDNDKIPFYDGLFHKTLASLSGNPLLNDIFAVINDMVDNFLGSVWDGISQSGKEVLIKAHEEILSGIEQGDMSVSLNAIIKHYIIAERMMNNKE